ncbi:uncharacterized protein LOC128414804 isoform X3 [Podarcis raffonei]|uniref:uncharacterized protein LOC128414804 isoform X3 n=1 Tax=Podarcis raffonei TaxID=65483 RepID=UPI0023295640|nr:uncharacterized protein LOC128414804 isoform X3 [Podarcis raffonei]
MQPEDYWHPPLELCSLRSHTYMFQWQSVELYRLDICRREKKLPKNGKEEIYLTSSVCPEHFLWVYGDFSLVADSKPKNSLNITTVAKPFGDARSSSAFGMELKRDVLEMAWRSVGQDDNSKLGDAAALLVGISTANSGVLLGNNSSSPHSSLAVSLTLVLQRKRQGVHLTSEDFRLQIPLQHVHGKLCYP